MSSEQPSNADDIIDSRDVINRIEELEGEREGLVEDALVMLGEASRVAFTALNEWDDDCDGGNELDILRDLAEQGEGYSDWLHGAQLISDSHFQEYAREFASDIGATNRETEWPSCHVDWEAAAEALQQDYSCIQFDGEDYWVR